MSRKSNGQFTTVHIHCHSSTALEDIGTPTPRPVYTKVVHLVIKERTFRHIYLGKDWEVGLFSRFQRKK